MLTLVRKGNKVYHNDIELTMVEQATKGPGNEVVKIEGLPNTNGQKWISLSRLEEGENKITGLKRVNRVSSYTLTKEEKAEVDELQARIEVIIQNAKERYVPRSKKVEDMSIEELQKLIESKKAELGSK